MMRFGIPAYRLPRDVLDAEVGRILAMGVELHLDSRVDDLEATMRDGRFDAAFVAVGAHLGKRAYIPAGNAARILDAVSVLRSMEGEEPPRLGRRVVVYGGGDTAMDVARTARRLGAEEAIVVYRRTRDRMPAHDVEVEEAEQEGVLMRWLSTVRHVDGGRLALERMELDADGLPAAHRRDSRSWRPTRSCSPSGRRATCRCSRAWTACASRTGWSRSARTS